MAVGKTLLNTVPMRYIRVTDGKDVATFRALAMTYHFIESSSIRTARTPNASTRWLQLASPNILARRAGDRRNAKKRATRRPAVRTRRALIRTRSQPGLSAA